MSVPMSFWTPLCVRVCVQASVHQGHMELNPVSATNRLHDVSGSSWLSSPPFPRLHDGRGEFQ